MIDQNAAARRSRVQVSASALLILIFVFCLQGCSHTDAPTATPPGVQAAATTAPAATLAPKQQSVALAKPTKQPTATAAIPQAKTPTPPTPRPTATRAPKPTNTTVTRAGPPGMPVVTLNQLPREAQHTIALIKAGGPFPYQRDGIEFQNRENRLPRKPRGYYHEYTVITPGSADRGARRVIAGSNGELYYTDNHYDSFSWVEA